VVTIVGNFLANVACNVEFGLNLKIVYRDSGSFDSVIAMSILGARNDDTTLPASIDEFCC
jgi:hypothetical protein